MASRTTVLLGLTAAALLALACSSSSTTSGLTSNCVALDACCASSSFPSASVATCNSEANDNVDSVCVTALSDYTTLGYCGGKGSGTGSGSGTGTGGTKTIACNDPSQYTCTLYDSVPSADQSTVDTICTSTQGTVGSACPTANVVGCCSMNTQVADGYNTEICYYSGGTIAYTASTVMADCTGTFTTKP